MTENHKTDPSELTDPAWDDAEWPTPSDHFDLPDEPPLTDDHLEAIADHENVRQVIEVRLSSDESLTGPHLFWWRDDATYFLEHIDGEWHTEPFLPMIESAEDFDMVVEEMLPMAIDLVRERLL